jgi:hypothetical protein
VHLNTKEISGVQEKDEIEARPGAFNDSPRERAGYTQAAHVSCRQRYPGPEGILAKGDGRSPCSRPGSRPESG